MAQSTQEQILTLIRARAEAGERAPTDRELARAVGRDISGVRLHLTKLENRRAILRVTHGPRRAILVLLDAERAATPAKAGKP